MIFLERLGDGVKFFSQTDDFIFVVDAILFIVGSNLVTDSLLESIKLLSKLRESTSEMLFHVGDSNIVDVCACFKRGYVAIGCARYLCVIVRVVCRL